MQRSKKTFSTRAFVSILLAICFLGLAVSGIVMYVAPPCSIAERTNWTLLLLSKEQWASLHQVTALIIVILSVIHLFIFNWRTFMHYLKRRKLRRSKQDEQEVAKSWYEKVRIPRELIAALVVSVILYLGAITLMAPFGWLHEGSDAIRDYYRREAPAGRGEGRGLGYFQGYGIEDREGRQDIETEFRPLFNVRKFFQELEDLPSGNGDRVAREADERESRGLGERVNREGESREGRGLGDRVDRESEDRGERRLYLYERENRRVDDGAGRSFEERAGRSLDTRGGRGSGRGVDTEQRGGRESSRGLGQQGR